MPILPEFLRVVTVNIKTDARPARFRLGPTTSRHDARRAEPRLRYYVTTRTLASTKKAHTSNARQYRPLSSHPVLFQPQYRQSSGPPLESTSTSSVASDYPNPTVSYLQKDYTHTQQPNNQGGRFPPLAQHWPSPSPIHSSSWAHSALLRGGLSPTGLRSCPPLSCGGQFLFGDCRSTPAGIHDSPVGLPAGALPVWGPAWVKRWPASLSPAGLRDCQQPTSQ
jgi:hypothetical protein